MDPPDGFSTGDKPSPAKRSGLRGPRPTPLKLNKDSYKIKKPPVVPQQPHHHRHPNLQPPPVAPPHPAAATTTTRTQNSQPVIIYAVSPKVIHITVSDFMDLVQRLSTGSANTSSSSFTSTTSSSSDTYTAAAARDISPEPGWPPLKEQALQRERAAFAAAAAAFAAATTAFATTVPLLLLLHLFLMNQPMDF